MAHKKLLAPVFTGFAVLSAYSAAQTQETAPETASEKAIIETVVVTAQYRQENAQDVSITTAVFDENHISQFDIHGAGSLAAHVPGLSFASFAPGQPLVAIRGIISADDGAGMDNSIAIFLDGIYIGRHGMVNFDMFDIERIEVLKGPQGTLYGRNAIGGALNVITKKPSQDSEKRISFAKGNYNSTHISAFANGPLSDVLSANISVNLRQHDGHTKNVLLDTEQQDENTQSVRARLRYETAMTEWFFNMDVSTDERKGMGRTPIQNNGPFDYVSLWQTLGGQANVSTAPIDGFSDSKVGGISLETLTHFSAGTLTTLTGRREAESDWEMASVGAPLGGGFDLAAGVYGTDVNDDVFETIDQTSFEIRWHANPVADWTYTFGAFALAENTHRIEQFKLDRNTLSTGQVTVGNEISDQENSTHSFALYGHTHWAFNPKWRLLIGARLSYDKKEIDTLSLNCSEQSDPLVSSYPECNVGASSLAILQRTFFVEAEESWQDVSPKLSLEYHPRESMMVFGSISKGYKSGGFSGSPGLEEFATTPIDPENVWSYELGLKSDWLEQRARLNVSAFYMDYDDLQSVHFGPSPISPGFGSFITKNIDNSVMSGVEFDATYVGNAYWDVTAAYAYLESEVKTFTLETASGTVDLSGTALRQAPKNSTSLTLNMHVPFNSSIFGAGNDNPKRNGGTIHAYLQYQHKDKQISDYINQATQIDRLEVFNLGAQWVSPTQEWELAFWANNITDRRYISHAYSIGPGIIGVWGEPRTAGIRLTWRQ